MSGNFILVIKVKNNFEINFLISNRIASQESCLRFCGVSQWKQGAKNSPEIYVVSPPDTFHRLSSLLTLRMFSRCPGWGLVSGEKDVSPILI